MGRALTRPPQAIVSPPAAGRPAGRPVHPWAWWVWAIGAAVAVSLARNPLLLTLLVAAVIFVVLQRRSQAVWARSLGVYLLLAVVIVAVRLVFQIVLGGLREGTVVFRLPEIGLPAWAAGIRLGGPVTLEGLLFTGFDAARMAGLLLAIGAANTLANPRRTLRNVPAACHQVATALVIAISVAPQLIESVFRVRRARRLRGGPGGGFRGLASVVVPVLEDAIDRSLALAAGMESRGYGRTRAGGRLGAAEAAALLIAMLTIVFGTFVLLGLPGGTGWASGLLGFGLLCGVWALRQSGARLGVTRYRPDRFGGPEWVVCLCGILAGASVVWLAHSDPAMSVAAYPLVWPRLSWPMILAAAIIAVPGVVTPPEKGSDR